MTVLSHRKPYTFPSITSFVIPCTPREIQCRLLESVDRSVSLPAARFHGVEPISATTTLRARLSILVLLFNPERGASACHFFGLVNLSLFGGGR
jgi:hypothetical protein